MEIIEKNGFKEKVFMEISCLDVFYDSEIDGYAMKVQGESSYLAVNLQTGKLYVKDQCGRVIPVTKSTLTIEY